MPILLALAGSRGEYEKEVMEGLWLQAIRDQTNKHLLLLWDEGMPSAVSDWNAQSSCFAHSEINKGIQPSPKRLKRDRP